MAHDDDLEAALHARHHRHGAYGGSAAAGVSLYGGMGSAYGPTGQLTTALSPAQFPDHVDADDDDDGTATGGGMAPNAPVGGAT